MDIEDPRFEDYETRFRALAERAEKVLVPKPSLNATRYYLCLYGENGLSPEEEFEFLERMESEPPENLKRLEVETDYWQDTVLFVP
jgi:hypothetical protein